MSIETNSNQGEFTSQPSERSYLDERRAWMRFGREPGTDYAVIISPYHLAGRVEIIDESLGGFGFVVDDAAELRVRQDLEMIYASTFYRAKVRHISTRPDGRIAVGVSCR